MFFENDTCYFIWKPPKIASTYGQEQSFLDILFDTTGQGVKICKENVYMQENSGVWGELNKDKRNTFVGYMSDLNIHPVSQTSEIIIEHLRTQFSHEQEFGLLNRLDNETSGLLYFAKTKTIYNLRKQWQESGHISKYYLAHTQEHLLPQNITTPIAHHKNGKKMITCTPELMGSRRKQKIKGKLLQASTCVIETRKHFTIISIQKGRRHQIRVHLASCGAPILGDCIYNPDCVENMLHLWSIGCVVDVL